AIRTSAGDIPTVDFRSYDPGRYYWTSGGFILFSQGIIGLRLSVALFQFIGIWLGLLSTKRAFRNRWALVLVGLLLTSWMYPRHKLFEHSLALIGIYAALQIIEKPVLRNYLFVGIVTGLAAFMGRNHGLYHLMSNLSLILYLGFGGLPEHCG
ncbi:MAG: hypothetical protein IH612_13305, partial [Desulfofustis sp.]|nr:hypothetical protein [Desulfofustis sp.]